MRFSRACTAMRKSSNRAAHSATYHYGPAANGLVEFCNVWTFGISGMKFMRRKEEAKRLSNAQQSVIASCQVVPTGSRGLLSLVRKCNFLIHTKKKKCIYISKKKSLPNSSSFCTSLFSKIPPASNHVRKCGRQGTSQVLSDTDPKQFKNSNARHLSQR